MSRKPASPALSAEQLLIAWQSASLLLGYPEEELLAQLGMVRSASERLPERVGEPGEQSGSGGGEQSGARHTQHIADYLLESAGLPL